MKSTKHGAAAVLLAIFSVAALASQPAWVTVVSPQQLHGHTWQIDKAHIKHLKDRHVTFWARHTAEVPDRYGIKTGVGQVNAECGGATVTNLGTIFYGENGNVISDPHITQVASAPPGSAWSIMVDWACEQH